MSILLTKILYYSVDDRDGGSYTNPTNITDAISFDAQRGLDIKNNTLSFRLKNVAQRLDDNGNLVHRYVDSTTFETTLAENDQFKIWARYTDDASIAENADWDDNTTEPASDYLLGTFFLTDYSFKQGTSGTETEVLCIDKTAVLFNQLLPRSFPQQSTTGTTTGATTNKLVDSGAKFTETANPAMRVTNTTDDTATFVTAIDNDTTLSLNDDIFTSGEDYKLEWTAPSMIQKIIRVAAEKQDGIKSGSGNESGVSYDVDAKTNAEGGFIQDSRRSTTENGSTNTDTAFPAKSLTKVWKPMYEWIGELSDIEFLNDADEINNTDPIVYGQSFIFWIDEDNIFHWVERSTTVDTEINIDTATDIYSTSLTRTVFDSVNFIVFRGGEDLYGVGTLGYDVDTTAGAKNLRMRVIAMTDIATNLIEEEKSQGNITEDNSTPGEFTFSGNRYTATFPVTATWNSVSYANADAYNEALRKEIKRLGENRARNVIRGLAGQRLKGSLEKKGEIITPGTVFSITDTDNGVVNEKIRAINTRHNFSTEGWFTTIELEQDEDAIINEA